MPLSNSIALYGGSFNPPHVGHQITCLWLTETLNAHKVYVVPTYEHYFGKDLCHFEHRLNMCKLMANAFNTDRVMVSDAERHLPKPNVTVNLVKYFNIHHPDKEIAVVIGSDLVKDLHKWYKWDEVQDMAKIIVVGRSGFDPTNTKMEVYSYPIELSAVSSTEIRHKLYAEQDVTGMVPDGVKKYIHGNCLYVQS